ncbi:TM2 domain-containing protein [Muricauda sp. SCSIO 64092]|uniref:TM2 domain-containing protein n=1 Tax=Allomuricauda sp. SCSIO 64092 TaxID=2908842 RepID=UPI001FF1A3D7|nr:TM2 domain-containing protein [Muricauda sp. SCSIO 64092]UOY05039.1 TM2 domain-containing protein [Muricauda sp. SCSIO 64092]
MNKHYLISKMKSTGTAYLCWFFLGCHYAYLGKWGLQILYWITLGGFGVWALIDLFHIPTKVSSHNLAISAQIDDIEKKEKDENHAKNMAMMAAASGNKNAPES